MKILKVALLVLAVAFVVAQFIRPSKNLSDTPSRDDITAKFPVPDSVRLILQSSCYDCHSNTTRYPWYAEVQPVGWWLNNHITEGKRELNFSEFSGYKPRKQFHKLDKIVDEVRKEGMPLPSYLLIHTGARLSDAQKQTLIAWANTLKDSVKSAAPEAILQK